MKFEQKSHPSQKCDLPRLRGHAWQVSCGGQRRAAGQISESGHRHDVTQPLNCTSPCFMSQIKCHDLSHGTIDQTIDLHAAAARCSSSAASSSSAAPSGPGSSISSQDNFHLIITAKIFINCDYNPLSLMSGHSKRYNCPLVRVTAAIDSSLQHSVPENIYCLVG